MRLNKGIVVDKEKTFGKLRFSDLHRENLVMDEEGNPTDEVKDRVYDLKSSALRGMIQVKIPAYVDKKEFDYNAEVEIVNPKLGTVASPYGNGATVTWYIHADDIVLKGKAPTQASDTKAKV